MTLSGFTFAIQLDYILILLFTNVNYLGKYYVVAFMLISLNSSSLAPVVEPIRAGAVYPYAWKGLLLVFTFE